MKKYFSFYSRYLDILMFTLKILVLSRASGIKSIKQIFTLSILLAWFLFCQRQLLSVALRGRVKISTKEWTFHISTLSSSWVLSPCHNVNSDTLLIRAMYVEIFFLSPGCVVLHQDHEFPVFKTFYWSRWELRGWIVSCVPLNVKEDVLISKKVNKSKITSL